MVLRSMENTVGNLGFRKLDQRGRIERSQKQAFTQRVVMTLFGGAALIGPMLVMTLHPSKNTSLITVSVATFIFALVLHSAAVLVVFVGTNMAAAS